MNSIISLTLLGISLVSASYFIINLWNFIKFFCDCPFSVSTHQSAKGAKEDPLNCTLTDLGLILLFIVQHKLMSIVSTLVEGSNIQPVFRSLYVLSTGIVIQIMLKFWLPTPAHIVWNLSAVLPSPLLWTMPVLQTFLLLLTVIQVLMADLPLLLGIKQIWYSIENRGNPLHYKSSGLRRYLHHVPHPVLAPILALWCRNVMSVDCFILVCGLTAYSTQLKADRYDINYVRSQLNTAYLD